MNTPDTSAGHTPTPKLPIPFRVLDNGQIHIVCDKGTIATIWNMDSFMGITDADIANAIIESCNSHDAMKAALSQWWQGMQSGRTMLERSAYYAEAERLTRAFFENQPVQESVEPEIPTHSSKQEWSGFDASQEMHHYNAVKSMIEKEAKASAEVAALRRDRDELAAWKESMMSVTSKCDMQKLANLLGLVIGQDIYPNLIPKVEALKAERDELQKERDAYKSGCESAKRDANEWYGKYETNQTEKVNLKNQLKHVADHCLYQAEQLTAHKKLVESLPHDLHCELNYREMHGPQYVCKCTCWKSKVPAEEPDHSAAFEVMSKLDTSAPVTGNTQVEDIPLVTIRKFMEARKISEAAMLDYLKEEGRIADYITNLESVPDAVLQGIVDQLTEMLDTQQEGGK